MQYYLPLVNHRITRVLRDVIKLVRHVRAVERAVVVMCLVRRLVNDGLEAEIAKIVVVKHVSFE